jgi:hypothetical protein
MAAGQTWTSPDGFISLTRPDATQFQELPDPPPPFLGLWVSNDESMKLGIVKLNVPTNLKLIQSSVEDGLAEEIGGKASRLGTKIVSGHEVWCMAARGPSGEIIQAVLRHDDALYKLIAITVGDKGDDASVNRFIDSLSITQPTTPSPNQSVSHLGGGADSNMLLHELSKKIGGLSCLLAIGLLFYFFLRGKKTPPSSSDAAR